MGEITRRETLGGIGAGLCLLNAAPVFAQTTRIRHAVNTVNGQRMLRKYAEAVRRMNDPALAQGSPRSWLFQWYVHAVPLNKQSELTRVYGVGQPRLRAVADQVWDTCQAHFGGDPDMFLPWHRMYLLSFESIVRAVLNDDDFTLPYWDYTQSGKRSLPAEFRNGALPAFSPLRKANRKKTPVIDINAGDPMDKGATVSPYNLESLKLQDYGGELGFCSTLDGTLHGIVHTGVGDRTNMGNVPTAAGDPIFWLHHCNIDRLWAAWNKGGGINPATPAKFAFAAPDPAGTVVEFDAKDMGDVTPLGYQYDTLPTRPPQPVSAGTAGGPPRTVATSARGVRLDTGATRIPLRPSAVGGVISGSVSSLTATGQVFIVFKDLNSNVEPGTIYEAFVDLPANPTDADKRARYLGTFSFFGRTGDHVHSTSGGPSFNVTETFRTLRARNELGSETTVTIIPVGAADPAAVPLIGTIELVRK